MATLPKVLQDALMVQMNRELVAKLLYKQSRYDMRMQGWQGFHKFFRKQEDEEDGHSVRFSHYLDERGVRPVISNVVLPSLPFSENPKDYFDKALALEKQYTEYINELYKIAEDEDDYDTCYFLDWFVKEQHDSVDDFTKIVKKFERAGNDNAALLELDEKLK